MSDPSRLPERRKEQEGPKEGTCGSAAAASRNGFPERPARGPRLRGVQQSGHDRLHTVLCDVGNLALAEPQRRGHFFRDTVGQNVEERPEDQCAPAGRRLPATFLAFHRFIPLTERFPDQHTAETPESLVPIRHTLHDGRMMGGKKPRNGREPAEPDPLGLTEPVRVIRETLFTRRHAEMLFDQVTDLLGEEAWIETRNAGTQRSVYRREAPGAQTITPWPVLKLGLGGRLSTVIPLMGPPGAPAEPPPRPGRAPRLRGLGPGEILIHDGSRSVTVTYGEDGRWFETTRSGDLETLAAVVPALAHKSAQPVELLADFVAGLDPRKSGPGLPASLISRCRSLEGSEERFGSECR